MNKKVMTKISDKETPFTKFHGYYHVRSITRSTCKNNQMMGKSEK